MLTHENIKVSVSFLTDYLEMALLVPTLKVLEKLRIIDEYQLTEVNMPTLKDLMESLASDFDFMKSKYAFLATFRQEFQKWHIRSLAEFQRKLEICFENLQPSLQTEEKLLWIYNTFLADERGEVKTYGAGFLLTFYAKLKDMETLLVALADQIRVYSKEMDVISTVVDMNQRRASRKQFFHLMSRLGINLYLELDL